jgi:hypothetical protein
LGRRKDKEGLVVLGQGKLREPKKFEVSKGFVVDDAMLWFSGMFCLSL